MEASFSEIFALFQQFKPLNENARNQAEQRNNNLTKPRNSLGRLENLACWYAAVRNQPLNLARIAVFAGNHGIAQNNIVSAFPFDVTASMVQNFQQGGAAINQIAKIVDAEFLVYELQLETPTQDFTKQAAMQEEECARAIAYGMMAVDDHIDVIVPGEMGIGNTSAAAAIYYAIFGGKVADWVGRGTGIDDAIYENKKTLISDAVKLHQNNFTGDYKALEILRHVGGFEIAAMVGLLIAARIANVAVILDGFVSCAAAAVLYEISPDYLDHCVAGHLSDEQAHKIALQKINKSPILNLNMRLGEASGGALAISILRAAVACQTGMATFAEALVSTAEKRQ